MPRTFENTLVIAISSRALFDLSESHAVYTEQGVDAYCKYQIEHENEALAPGVAFPMVKKFLALNDSVSHSEDGQLVEIVLISRNSADTGLRIFNSIEHYGLDITRAAFTGGQSPYRYVKPFGGDLFLSSDPLDVRQALEAGHAAATILPSQVDHSASSELRIAFDGDAVLFSDQAEQVFQSQGLDAFSETEKRAANDPLPGGPFKNVLAALHRIQQNLENPPVRTALITARSAPAHERVIKTLRAWDIRIDESYFLGGMDKGEFLRSFGADIFFDDQRGHCESARKHVPTGHVPSGIANQ
jgi:5'-nucleotidase